MATYTDYNPSQHNDFMTPRYLWEQIKDYIPKDKVISMPFYGDGECGLILQQMGFNVYHEDEDFIENDRGDVVVDNPPYETKRQVITKLVERNKPFMLIVPVSTICYKYSQILKDHLQLMIPPKRPKYIKYNKETGEHDQDWEKKSSAFDCVWVCWKMNLPQDIIYLKE